MFKKLKDKIAEEVKISPLKLQTSVQQLAQAMVSPSSSVNSIQESTSNDNFSISEDSEVLETPRNSPNKENSTFHRVDLHGDTVVTSPRCPTVPRSRRSSASSMMSDASSLFPLYESPSNAYHFQSDLESTSEIEEIGGSTSHLQGISKEQLLTAYRKTQSRYHKYKGRYVDLARHFRELERQNGKIKVVLTETQDRSLRKIAELKEQCLLEQKAKAHLEDVLRNDLEEKDHLIETLETKVRLLKCVDETCGQKQHEFPDKPLVNKQNQGGSHNYVDPSIQDKIDSLESQLLQHQQSLKEQSEKLKQLKFEKEKVDNDLLSQEAENQRLKRELEAQRKREEEAALSLAENKMQVHRELEAREEESKNLKALVAQLQEDLRISNRKKAIGNGDPIAASSESISSSVFEEAVSGDDIMPTQPNSELNQLKEVLRKKYKEVEVLVEENGRLRASLIMSTAENGCPEKKVTNSEGFVQPDLDNIVINVKSNKHPPEEVDLLQVQCAEELLLKDLVVHEVFNETSELNKKNLDLTVESQTRNGAEIKRQLSDAKNELEKVRAEWECKYTGVKEELEKLLLEKAEAIKLLSLWEIPTGFMDDCDGNLENEGSLLHFSKSVLREKSSWKKEEERLAMKLKDLDNECCMLKEMIEKMENEKGQLEANASKSVNQVSLLNKEVKSLKELTNKLNNEKKSLQDEVLRLQEISTSFEKLKNELENFQRQSKISLENVESQCSSKVFAISSALEEKEKQLKQAKAELKEAVSKGTHRENKLEEELLDKCRSLEKELVKERESRLLMEQNTRTSQMVFLKEFVSTLGDGKSLLQEACKNLKQSELEKDKLKAELNQLSMQLKDNETILSELKQVYDKELKESELEKEKLKAECNRLSLKVKDNETIISELGQVHEKELKEAGMENNRLKAECSRLSQTESDHESITSELRQMYETQLKESELEKENLKAECDRLSLKVKDNETIILELRQVYNKDLKEAGMENNRLKAECSRLSLVETDHENITSELRQMYEKQLKESELEQENLKAECNRLSLKVKDKETIISELKQVCEKHLMESDEYRKVSLKEIEHLIQERDELKMLQTETQKKAISALSELDALAIKKKEAENRAAKVQNELKVMRELEEKAKVEAEEAVQEQAAMRRSWEMQRDQIESMSREIEELKKAEEGLIRVLKEVREEVKNKDLEINGLLEEKNAFAINEEKMKSEVGGLKNLIEQHTLMEEQIKKEMEKMREASSEWKAKIDIHNNELEIMDKEKKSLQKMLEEQESSQLKSIEAIKRLTDELETSTEHKRRLQLQLDSASKEIEMSKITLDENKKEMESMSSRIEEMVVMERELRGGLEEMKDETNRVRGQKQETEELIEQIKEERDKYKYLAEELRQKLERLEINLDELKKSHREVESEREQEKIEEETKRKNLEEKINEILKREEEKGKELELLRSQDLKESESREDDKEFEKEKGMITENEGEKDLIKQLETDRDEAVKNLEEASGKIRMLEERIVSLESMIKVEKEEFNKEVHISNDDLNVKSESLNAGANNSGVEDELKRINKIKAELEENLLEVQKQAEKKNELEVRVNEMEQLMKNMEKEFDETILNKEEEYQEQLSIYSEKMEQEVGYVRKQLMEEVKGLREELIAKREAYDQLMEKHNSMINENKVEIDTVRRKLTDKMNEAAKSETSKWIDHISELENNHRKMLEDLRRKWDAEKKSLEETSKVAVAAVESGSGSMSYLRQQILAQAKELSETKRKYNSEILELRHLLSLGRRGTGDYEKSRIEESTELEYLRNILYEYMMGKEPMVLAKVIAAVVKFDDEQTKKVLTKEEQKQTLLGQFGLT